MSMLCDSLLFVQICCMPGMTPLPTGTPLVLSCLFGLVQAIADLARLIQLIFLLLPVVCWAPLALHYGCRRKQWMQHFRYCA